MTELALLYSPQDIQDIEKALECCLDSHLQNLVSSRVEAVLSSTLQPLNSNIHIPLHSSNAPQLALLQLFSEIDEGFDKKLVVEQEQVMSARQQAASLNKRLSEQQTQNQKKGKSINNLEDELKSTIGKNQELKHMLYRFQEIILMQQSQIDSIRAEATHKELATRLELQNQMQVNQQKNQTIQLLQSNLALLRLEKEELESGLVDISQEMTKNVETASTNLVTWTIQAASVQDTHLEYTHMLAQCQAIHKEQQSIIKAVHLIQNQLSSFDLSSLPFQSSSFGIPSFESFFEGQNSILCNLGSTLTKFQQRISELIRKEEEQRSQLQQNSNKLKEMNLRQTEREEILKSLKEEKGELQARLRVETEKNYKVLLEVTQNKKQLQNELSSKLKQIQKITQQLSSIQQANASLQSTNKQLKCSLHSEQEKNADLVAQADQSQKVIAEMRERSSLLQQSLKEVATGQQSSVVQKLLQNEASLTLQASILRSSVKQFKQQNSLLQQTVAQKDEQLKQTQSCYQQALAVSSSLSEQCQRLEGLHRMQEQISSNHASLLHQKDTLIHQLEQQIQQHQALIENPIIHPNCEQSTQTEEQPVRKQHFLNQSVERAAQLPGDKRGPHKQKENCPGPGNQQEGRFKVRQKDDCPHLRKIWALNQVVNFIMNHIKGYIGEQIRPNSWFSHQIQKHGSKYEAKLRDQDHLRAKAENKSLVEDICSREAGVGRLVEQFKAIMEFYFCRCLEASSYDKGDSRVHRTVNKLNPKSGYYR